MRARLALLTLALFAAGCAKREHANPFDPENPETGGRPTGFAATAGPGLVELRWNVPNVPGPVGFQVYRRVAGEADFSPASLLLPASVTSLTDFGLANGVLHEYRLYYVFGTQSGGLPASDYATPGPRRPWVAELGEPGFAPARAHLLSPDGHHVRRTLTGLFGPTGVAYDRSRDRVWVADTYDGSVLSFDPDYVTRAAIVGLSEPVAIAVDSTFDDLWVCDQARGAVLHYTRSGAPKGPTSIASLSYPTSIALDPVDGALWVCERNGNRVRRFSRSGTPLSAIATFSPSRVAVDSTTRDAWVTSAEGGRVLHLPYSGGVADSFAVAAPVGIAVDWRRGRIWVADAAGGQVLAMRRSGLVEFAVRGLPAAREVAVDLASGECWATVDGLDAVVRISPAGAVLERLGGFRHPWGIVVDSGP